MADRIATIERNGNTITAARGDGTSWLTLRSANGDEIITILTHEQWAVLMPMLGPVAEEPMVSDDEGYDVVLTARDEYLWRGER